MYILLKLAQLKWTGHAARMPEERLPKKILYGELETSKHTTSQERRYNVTATSRRCCDVVCLLGMGKRSYGVQKKQYKDTLKASFKDFSIPTESWEQIAQDREKWRSLIRRGASEYEAKRISEAEQKHAQHKVRAN